jgi:hypothetical protein
MGTIDLARAAVRGEFCHGAMGDARGRTSAGPSFGEDDGIKHAHALSNDPARERSSGILGTETGRRDPRDDGLGHAQGSDGIVVAVLDTGVLFDSSGHRLGRGRRAGSMPGYDIVGPRQATDVSCARTTVTDATRTRGDPGDWHRQLECVGRDEFLAPCATHRRARGTARARRVL